MEPLPDPDRRLAAMRDVLEARANDIAFSDEPELVCEIAALGLWNEIGTPNDQVSFNLRFAGTDTEVPRELARAELVQHRGQLGVRIRYAGVDRIDCAKPSLVGLVHPPTCFNEDGTLRELVLFPITIARIAKAEDIDLVIVPSWARDMSFSPAFHDVEYSRGFGVPERWGEVRFWIDHYCRLIESRRVPFFTTHDLTSHIAGIKAEPWPLVMTMARRLRESLGTAFGDEPSPPVHGLVLPFMAAYLVDGLSQPYHADTERLVITLDILFEAISKPVFRGDDRRVFRHFPACYHHVLRYTRDAPDWRDPQYEREIRVRVDAVVAEIEADLRAS